MFHGEDAPYSVRVHGKRTVVEIVERNGRTVIVRLPDGHIVKRHIEKHGLMRGKRRVTIW
jgi:hypothetical protein